LSTEADIELREIDRKRHRRRRLEDEFAHQAECDVVPLGDDEQAREHGLVVERQVASLKRRLCPAFEGRKIAPEPSEFGGERRLRFEKSAAQLGDQTRRGFHAFLAHRPFDQSDHQPIGQQLGVDAFDMEHRGIETFGRELGIDQGGNAVFWKKVGGGPSEDTSARLLVLPRGIFEIDQRAQEPGVAYRLLDQRLQEPQAEIGAPAGGNDLGQGDGAIDVLVAGDPAPRALEAA